MSYQYDARHTRQIMMSLCTLLLVMGCSKQGNSEQPSTQSTAQVKQDQALDAGQSVQALSSSQQNGSQQVIANQDFVLIKAGSFQMGEADSPQQQVNITDDFYLSKYEVTQAQWQAVMGSSSFDLDQSNSFYNLPGMKERITKPDHPATVSWNDAQRFIEKLNKLDPQHSYRLPTEAEWEYAAKAGTNTPYSFGNDQNQLKHYAWYGEDFRTGGSHPVGQKRPNPWGLYDMHGNVWEWVADGFVSVEERFSGSPSTAVLDNPQVLKGTEKVVKGGSWHITADGWTSAFRKSYPADYRGISIGFRLVKTLKTTAK